MRLVLFFLVLCVLAAWGCAETSACPPGDRLVDGVCAPQPRRCDETISRTMPVGCVLSLETFFPNGAFFDWELTVEPVTILSGEPFSLGVTGRMLFTPDALNTALDFGLVFTRAEVAKAEGRITVEGARVAEGGAPVTLKADFPKTCTYDENGKRGLGAGPFPPCSKDTDCMDPPGESDPANRCAFFRDFKISEDCDVCTGLGFPELCEDPGFCAVKGVEVPLGVGRGTYVAEGPGSVFIGWADDVPLIEFGADRGAFDMREQRRRTLGEDIKFSGLDVLIGPAELVPPLLFECAMGVTSRGPDGPPTATVLVSPAPRSMLISCPIE